MFIIINEASEVRFKRIVLTGATGAHKTTILKVMAANGFTVLPEAASILWDGGWPWRDIPEGRSSIITQLAIAQVQISMETLQNVLPGDVVQDRGFLDQVAYSSLARGFGENTDLDDVHVAVEAFCRAWGSTWTLNDVYKRYDGVILLRLPEEEEWIDNNPNRLEDYEEALESEQRLCALWGFHPYYCEVDGTLDVIQKIQKVDSLIGEFTPMQATPWRWVN